MLSTTRALNIALDDLQSETRERRRLEGEILAVSEREQARLGSELHDNLGQQLVGTAMLLQVLANQLTGEAHPLAADAKRIQEYLAESLATTRSLAKSFYPVTLEQAGLRVALEELAVRTELQTKVRSEVVMDPDFTLEKESAIHLYRIVQEALTNAIKHGRASYVRIECHSKPGLQKVVVTDDGRGFTMPSDKASGLGLHLFQYRARLIGAEVEIRNCAAGGCQVICSMRTDT